MNIREQSATVANEILKSQYFVPLFQQALYVHKMTIESVIDQQEDDASLIEMWNTFWFALPDSGSIRRGPFFVVCELAEHVFDEPQYEELT